MRKTTKIRAKCLVGVAVIAALVTLLSPYPFTPHPRLQGTHSTQPTPTARLYSHETDTGKDIQLNETERKTSNTYQSFLTKSPAEIRVEEKVEGMQVRQEELPVSEGLSLENIPPKEWVEVKKTNPKVGKEGGGARRDRWRKKSAQKDASKFRKTLGLSPKELQERAKTFSESSPLRAFLKEQERRIAHISTTCRSFQPSPADVVAGSRGPPVSLLSIRHIIYDRVNQLTFCPVYKAASTSWTVTLLQLAGLWTAKTRDQRIQRLVRMFYPKLSGLAASTVTANTTHFMVVRHPLERLLSCYLDKFQNASKTYYYHLYSEKIIQRYRASLAGLPSHQVKALQEEVRAAMRKGPVDLPDNPFASPLGPTFPEFVEHVVNTKYDDEHWRTYTTHCAPCALTYEFVLRFESLQQENKWFLEYLNRSGEVAPRWDNHNPSGDTKKLSCDYYGQLSLRQIDSLVAKYRKDLLLYEYDVEEYRQCAKDYVQLTSSNGVIEQWSTTTTTTVTTTTSRTAATTGGDGGGVLGS